MSHVFISYVSKDKAFADAVKVFLNRNGLETWDEQESISVGSKYVVALMNAITSAGAVVLVFSENAMLSQWVEHNIAYAFTHAKQIFPVQIDNAPLSETMELMLSTRQIVRYHDLLENKDVADRFLESVRKAVCDS